MKKQNTLILIASLMMVGCSAYESKLEGTVSQTSASSTGSQTSNSSQSTPPTSTPVVVSPASKDAFKLVEAESAEVVSSMNVGPTLLGSLQLNGYANYKRVDFGSVGAQSFTARFAVPDSNANQKLEIRLDSVTGTLIGTLTVKSTGGWGTFVDQNVSIAKTTGTHDVYLISRGNHIGNFDRFTFSKEAVVTPTPVVVTEPPVVAPPVVQPPTNSSASFITVDQMRNDVAPQSILKSDYALPAPALTGFDWYGGWRPGNGPNPPAGFSAQVGWYEIFTNRDNPPGDHNWGVAVLRIVELEERNGRWAILRDTTDPKLLQEGIRMATYSPQVELPIETRIRKGRFEVKMPNEGGNFHGFPVQMTINCCGATNRLVLVQMGLVVWDETKADDRSLAIAQRKAAVCHVGLDYWRYAGAPFKADFSNNSDMGISRSRTIGLIESPSWHSQHTIDYFSSEASFNSAVTAIKNLVAP